MLNARNANPLKRLQLAPRNVRIDVAFMERVIESEEQNSATEKPPIFKSWLRNCHVYHCASDVSVEQLRRAFPDYANSPQREESVNGGLKIDDGSEELRLWRSVKSQSPRQRVRGPRIDRPLSPALPAHTRSNLLQPAFPHDRLALADRSTHRCGDPVQTTGASSPELATPEAIRD